MEIEKSHYVMGLKPGADFFNTDPVSDVISLAGAEGVKIIVGHNGGTTGKGTIKVQSCTDFSASSPTDLPFKYRKKTTGNSDVWGALTDAASTGVETVPTEDTLYLIEILASDLAGTDRDKIVVKFTETANDPVNGFCIFELYGLKYNNPAAGGDQTAIAAAGPVAQS